MLQANYLDFLDRTVRGIRGAHSKPFGGIQVRECLLAPFFSFRFAEASLTRSSWSSAETSFSFPRSQTSCAWRTIASLCRGKQWSAKTRLPTRLDFPENWTPAVESLGRSLSPQTLSDPSQSPPTPPCRTELRIARIARRDSESDGGAGV